MSARLWVMSQSSYMRHSSSHGPSMNACSSAVSTGALLANNFSNLGLPVNSSPSHHTVPASSASFSVCDIDGSRRMYALRNGREMIALRSGRTLNSHSVASITHRKPFQMPYWGTP
jgi:hypothetical protein